MAQNLGPYYDRTDGTLDTFLLAYCHAHAIECDGGVFSMYFSDRDKWSEFDAITVIEEAATTYGLRANSKGTLWVEVERSDVPGKWEVYINGSAKHECDSKADAEALADKIRRGDKS
jgi:hypothetical protein